MRLMVNGTTITRQALGGCAVVAVCWGAAAGCSAGEATRDTRTGTTTGTTTSSTTTSTGGGGATTTSTATGGTGGAGATGGIGGSGGTGGAGAGWPSCDSNPGGQVRTIAQIWQDDPATETAVWVPGVIITGLSYGGCNGGSACQIFVQQDATYASWNAGAQQAIKIFVSGATASHFVGLAVGDVVDVYAHAIRSTYQGRNELQLLVNALYPGCAKDVGDATPVPIANVTLELLTQQAYEVTHGPLLVQVDVVSGTPDTPTSIFGLWHTNECCDGGIEDVTSLSPHCMPSGQFQGLTQGQRTDFNFVQGVFGQYVPGTPPPSYEVLYPRSAADYDPI